MDDPIRQIKTVSVIIPIHNEEKTIERCLASVLNQNIFEAIVVLDNCTDDSERIAQDFSKINPKVLIHHLGRHKYKANYYAETVNFGVSKSTGEVICIVDSDTFLDDRYIETLLPHLQSPYASVSGKMKYLHKGFIQFHETIRGSGRMILREVWDEVGGFRDIITCDTYLDLELLSRGLKTKVVEDAYQYDLRDYTLRQLTVRAIRRGKGRKQIGQSLLFMLGHGLYTLMNSPFGVVELAGNIAGYLSTDRRTPREYMKRYEAKRVSDIIRKRSG